ncbi:hypothetical protein ACIQ4I_19500 [Rummeliibacillus sp. NPDC094406]|uniref:hypothetical protein n=1 Tax=Rummeliibacillus sp. NPDC094406 TaxID=3364511 RepID=UPI00381BF2C2
MELVKPSKMYVLKKQLTLKIQMHISSFMQLVIIELVMLLLTSYGGSMGEGTSSDNMIIDFKIHVPTVMFIITLFWLFVVILQLPSKEQRKIGSQFSYSSTNHVVGDLLLIGLFSLTIALTTSMANYLQAMIRNLVFGAEYIIGYTLWNAPVVFFNNLFTMTVIALAVGTFSYVISILSQISKWSIVGGAALVLIFKSSMFHMYGTFLENIKSSSNSLLFDIPFLIISLISMCIAYLMSNKLEVKM